MNGWDVPAARALAIVHVLYYQAAHLENFAKIMPVFTYIWIIFPRPATNWRRVQLLEQAGFIQGYHARLNRKQLGLGVHGFVSLRMNDHALATAVAFEREVVALPGAISCQNLSGGYDYQIELVATDHDAFAKLVREIRAFPGVAGVYTSFTLQEIKVGGALPIG